MHPQIIRTVPRVDRRAPFDGARWNMLARWVNGEQALFATLPDMDGASLVGIDPEAKQVSLAGGALLLAAAAMTVAVPATFDGPITANDDVTLGDADTDALLVNATAEFAAPAAFQQTVAIVGAATLNGAVTLGDAAGDAITINGTVTAVAPVTVQGAFAADSTVALGNAASDTVTVAGRLVVDTTTLVVDVTNDRVGVGTASPAAPLHAFAGATGGGLTEVLRLQHAGINAGDGPAITFCWNAGSPQLGARIGINPTGAAAADLLLQTGNGGAPTTKTRIYANGNVLLNNAGTSLGFYGATPAARPTVSGSRGGNAALASLLTALATLGLVTDSSTA